MKSLFIIAVVVAAAASMPVDEPSSPKTKRGIYGGLALGHAPLLSAPLHAPLAISHAPIVAPAPILHSSYAPAFSLRSYAVHAPALSIAHAPLASYHAPLASYHAPLSYGLGHAPLALGHSIW